MIVQQRHSVPIAWIALYAAIQTVTTYVPLIPYATGGGFLPLSIPVSAASTLVLGFWPGVIAACVGGVVGMLVNPVAYPFGPLDVFFVSVLPAITCGMAFRGYQRATWITYVAFLGITGLLGEIAPYYYPGSAGGFSSQVPQPLYAILVGIFFVPWVLVYITPIATRTMGEWLHGADRKRQFAAAALGALMGLMPWSIWMVFPVALALHFSVEVAMTTWIFALWSRLVLAAILAVVLVPMLDLLRRSGLPVPSDALWYEKR